MADWTDPPWAQLVAGKPWTDEKAAAAFENPIAVAEGAIGAPRIRIGALERLTAGDNIRSRNDALQTVDAGDVAFSFAFLQAGIVRFSYFVENNLIMRVIRVRNGVETVLYKNPNVNNYSATVDCPVLPGDTIYLKEYGGGPGVVRNIRLSTGGENLWPGSAARLEGNTYA